jgi:hypothetical protein
MVFDERKTVVLLQMRSVTAQILDFPILRDVSLSVFMVETIPGTGHGGPFGCETSRLPYFLYNRLIDGAGVLSRKHWLPFSSRKIPGTHFRSFLLETESTLGP